MTTLCKGGQKARRKGLGVVMRTLIVAILTAATLAFGATAALAADWTVTRLRGTVLQLVNGDWQPLARGAVVPEHRVVRTVGGRVTLVRGKESIELGPETAISIDDRGGAKPYTTVTQHFGQVAVEAEVKDVRHFAVETPFLVAVVKGTRFVVKSDRDESIVLVRRGAVHVADSQGESSVTVVAGQSASTHEGAPLTVAGRGDLPDVVDRRGKPLHAGIPNAKADPRAVQASANKGNNGNAGISGTPGNSGNPGSSGSGGGGSPGNSGSGGGSSNANSNAGSSSGKGNSPF